MLYRGKSKRDIPPWKKSLIFYLNLIRIEPLPLHLSIIIEIIQFNRQDNISISCGYTHEHDNDQ